VATVLALANVELPTLLFGQSCAVVGTQKLDVAPAVVVRAIFDAREDVNMFDLAGDL